MSRISVLFLTVMLTIGIVGLTQAAKKARPVALVDITDGSCVEPDSSLFGEILEAQWRWVAVAGEPPHTKFGGDAIFNVDVYIDDAEDPLTVAIDIEIVEPNPDESNAGKMPYSCVDSLCTGLAFVTEQFIADALAEMFPNAATIIFDPVDFSGEVWVKAMNPSFGSGSEQQNYPLVNVCEVEAEPTTSP